MSRELVADLRSDSDVERLLEDSWAARSARANRREQGVQGLSSLLFLAVSIPLAVVALRSHGLDLLLALVLCCCYALCAGAVRFPIGAGYVVPSYMVLVPMMLLLPVGAVPLLAAGSLVLGTAAQREAWRTDPRRILFAVADGWHTLGVAGVLLLAGSAHGGSLALAYGGAFAAGCLVDLGAATISEAIVSGVDSRLQLKVIAFVWLIDACIAPIGLLIALAAREHRGAILLILPLNALLVAVSRERTARIAQAQKRLDLLARERMRLQKAVARLGDALAAKLDIDSLIDVVLNGSLEALDAQAGRLVLQGDTQRTLLAGDDAASQRLLDEVDMRKFDSQGAQHLGRGGVHALALRFAFASAGGRTEGVLSVARNARDFRADEQELMRGLVERARTAAEEVTSHEALFEQAHTDALTGLGNRRRLETDLPRLRGQSPKPIILLLFDLDGFKHYNDTFGHPAGDALLSRLGAKLRAAVAPYGGAYRLGGDEFCVLVSVDASDVPDAVTAAASALEERGQRFAVSASYGAVALPHEASNLDYALQLADERMYSHKRGRPSRAGGEARDVLMRIMHAKQPSLEDHVDGVAHLCRLVGRRLGMGVEQLDELVRAAELHDIGKVGVPDAILQKPSPLSAEEWAFMHQHTILGERILSAASALRPVARLVRSSHERWDGKGYPDGLAGEEIPLGARVIAACDAYDAITTDRVYRGRRDHDAACRELRREAGHQFDPAVVDALLAELEQLERSGSREPAAREPQLEERRDGLAAEVVAQLQSVLTQAG